MHEFNTTIQVWMKTAFALLVTLALAAPALAVDGVREINQTTVDALGGFPFRVQQAGSYRLTGNLEIPDENTTGIVIEVPHVTLDLNGFSIQCSTCAGTGIGDGIFADSMNGNIAVRNGSVSNVGNRGIALTSQVAHVDEVQVTDAGGTGIELGERALLSRSQSTHNAMGIQVGKGSAVIDTIASQNTGRGIALNEFALIAGVTANENGGNGIAPTEGSVVIGSSANMNGGRGILSQETLIVQSSVGSNQSDGIDCFDCLVARSTVIGNAGIGIKGTGTGVGDNVLRFNDGAEISGPLEISQNICDSNLNCP